mgnify:CR=1 FL=1
MHPYKHALIGLDLTDMDETILSYLPTLLKALPLEKLFFVHIAPQLELPEDIIRKYPDLVAPVDETIAATIRKKIDRIVGEIPEDVETEIIVREGNPLEVLLKTARIKNIDLMVMGRKRDLKGSGILAGHVIRKSPTSMLIVPEGYRNGLKKMFLPVDFSRHSQMTYQVATIIKERTRAAIEFEHAYKLPLGYYKTGKTREEFQQIMKNHAVADFKKFCLENNIGEDCKCKFHLAEEKSVEELLYDRARRAETDLILIGSRGRTKTSALLIGSIVEKLVFEDTDIPIMVVKNKGESMTFFEALMKV